MERALLGKLWEASWAGGAWRFLWRNADGRETGMRGVTASYDQLDEHL